MPSLVLAEKKTEQEELKLERARDSSEGESQGHGVRGSPGLPGPPPAIPRTPCPPPAGCYFDGDKTWRGSGTRWHPVVPPFGLIKCAICTCKVSAGCRATHGCCELLGGGLEAGQGQHPVPVPP